VQETKVALVKVREFDDIARSERREYRSRRPKSACERKSGIWPCSGKHGFED
jgi:hypothetical protein